MTVSYVLFGAYWRPREESCESCGARTHLILSTMASHPALAQFFEQATSKEKSLAKPLPLDPAGLSAWLKHRKEDRKGPKYAIDAELGWSQAAWNGEDGDRSSVLRVACGMTSPWVVNVVTLRVSAILFQELRDAGQHLSIFQSIVKSFEADWALITSPEFRDAVGTQPGEKDVGLVTYTQKTIPEALLSKLPRQEIYSHGRLMWLGDDLPRPDDASAVSLAREIRSVLNEGS